MSEEIEGSLPPKKKMGIGKKIGIGFVGFIVFCFILGFLGGGSSSDTSSTASSETTAAASSEPTVDAAPWFPAGYTEVQDGIAFKWITPSCDYGKCNQASLIIRDGCPSSLYVETTEFDSTQTQIGFSNDSVGAVAPMQKVKMTFHASDQTRTMQFAKVSCY